MAVWQSPVPKKWQSGASRTIQFHCLTHQLEQTQREQGIISLTTRNSSMWSKRVERYNTLEDGTIWKACANCLIRRKNFTDFLDKNLSRRNSFSCSKRQPQVLWRMMNRRWKPMALKTFSGIDIYKISPQEQWHDSVHKKNEYTR